MTMTPWGDSAEFGRRKLRGGPGVPREVERNQRERIYGAMVAVAATKGYQATTVADLMSVAHVSRSTFYRLFPDKDACLLATLDPILSHIRTTTEAALRGHAPTRDRAAAALATFMAQLVSQPAAARLCVIEAEAAGPRAVTLVDRTVTQFEHMLAALFDELPDQHGMPPNMIAAMVGAIRKLVQAHLVRRTEAVLLEHSGHLLGLALAYRPPPRPLPTRAPRTPAAHTVERYRGVDEPAQKLELAAMKVIARDGYADSTVADIAKEAKVSLATVYRHFNDKSDLLASAMLRSRLRMAAATIPAQQRAPHWPDGIAALIHATLAFLEAEHDYARLVTVDIYGAGPDALETRDRALDGARHFIQSGLDRAGLRNPIAAEAIQSCLYSMLAARVRSRHRNLRGIAPLAIYMVLAPVIGPDDAYRHATT